MTPVRLARAAWRALPGDLLGHLIVRLSGARITRRMEVAGVGEVALAEGPRLAPWLDRVPRRPTAMTFGGVVVARVPLSDALVRHESEHVRQWAALGPLFLPAYLIASVAARRRGDDRYRDNALEVAAFAAEDRPRAVRPIAGYDTSRSSTDRSSGSPRA